MLKYNGILEAKLFEGEASPKQGQSKILMGLCVLMEDVFAIVLAQLTRSISYRVLLNYSYEYNQDLTWSHKMAVK